MKNPKISIKQKLSKLKNAKSQNRRQTYKTVLLYTGIWTVSQVFIATASIVVQGKKKKNSKCVNLTLIWQALCV